MFAARLVVVAVGVKELPVVVFIFTTLRFGNKVVNFQRILWPEIESTKSTLTGLSFE
jgi:hypothetical protein